MVVERKGAYTGRYEVKDGNETATGLLRRMSGTHRFSRVATGAGKSFRALCNLE